MFKLTDKTAVVTGAGSGIGRSVALLFAERGARVVALDLNLEAAEQTADSALPETIFPLSCDVASADSVTKAFAEIDGVLGKLDILVNSAGVAHVGNILSTDEEDFDRLYRVNVKGTYLCSRAAVPRMLAKSSGVIMNLASIASLGPKLASTLGLSAPPRVIAVEHHLAHLASAFYCSPYEEAACLSVDGFGDFVSTMLAVGRGNRIQPLERVFYPHSLGLF